MYPKKSIKRILSIDGGGIRGLIPLYYLALLEKDLIDRGLDSIFDSFDFFAGTSVGSLIIGSIVYTDSAGGISDLIQKYFNKENMCQIFYRSYMDKVMNLFLDRPKYNGIFKKILIKEAVGSQQLCDHSGKHVLIPTYNVSLQEAKFYKSYKLPQKNFDLVNHVINHANDVNDGLVRSESRMSLMLDDDDLLNVADILDASSAAPCYFPSVLINSEDQDQYCIDGAIFANNPVGAAYADALQLYPTECDIRILSIGTGYSAYEKLGPETLKWGLRQWILQGSLLDIFIGINQDVSDYTTRAFSESLGHTFIRVQESSVDVSIDDISQIDNMIIIANEWYTKTSKEVLREIFDIS